MTGYGALDETEQNIVTPEAHSALPRQALRAIMQVITILAQEGEPLAGELFQDGELNKRP